MGIAARLRRLDDRVLGPPKPPDPLWTRLGGGAIIPIVFGTRALFEGLRTDDLGYGAIFGAVFALAGVLLLAGATVVSFRRELKGFGPFTAAALWVFSGAFPLAFDAEDRVMPYVAVRVLLVAVGVVVAVVALRRRSCADLT